MFDISPILKQPFGVVTAINARINYFNKNKYKGYTQADLDDLNNDLEKEMKKNMVTSDDYGRIEALAEKVLREFYG